MERDRAEKLKRKIMKNATEEAEKQQSKARVGQDKKGSSISPNRLLNPKVPQRRDTGLSNVQKEFPDEENKGDKKEDEKEDDLSSEDAVEKM